ncbi:hypothetical protein RM96_07360 [Cupriavidus sp. IDO]|nr:hypothetical protein RM96_07360 [Cupriavidus sp. IDO]
MALAKPEKRHVAAVQKPILAEGAILRKMATVPASSGGPCVFLLSTPSSCELAKEFGFIGAGPRIEGHRPPGTALMFWESARGVGEVGLGRSVGQI